MPSRPEVAVSRLENSLEDLIDTYRDRQALGPVSLEDYWSVRSGSHSASTLAALVKLDLQFRFEHGERPRVAEYLDRFPILKANSDQVVSLVYEEFCLRQETGENPDSLEFCERYGAWRDSIRLQLAYHRDLSLAADARPQVLPFPVEGDQFDKYQIVRLIGTGAVARVYLALDQELGHRKTVIKVSSSFGQELKILGKLDHRNIVPLWSSARGESGLRGICMPYRSGMTLEELIRKIGRGTPPRKARRIREILDSIEEPSGTPPAQSQRSGWNHFPVGGTFPDAVAWIGLALSDALDYLHNQGVIHRDIKPANILLAHEEGPQLLDFNLSQEPDAPETVGQSMTGGTLPYMAPEHLQAFLEVSAWKEVGSSADLYSLGLVLRELATGCEPELPNKNLSLPRAIQALIVRRARPLIPARQINPLIPPTLDSILEKCLAFEPSERYRSAQNLSQDLRRYLDRRPLKYAPNPSRIERGVNWLYRNRFLASSALICSIVLFVCFILTKPKAIVDRPNFRQAMVQLDSKKSSDWELARQTFADIHRDFPESAWPSLYLALTLNKQSKERPSKDRKIVDEVSRLIKETREKPDAEKALRSRLEIEPESTLLRTNYALVLLQPARDEEDRQLKLKSEREEKARELLRDVLNDEPYQITALTALTKLERDTNHGDRAIDLSSKAVESAIRTGQSWDKVYFLRKVMVSCLSRLADQIIQESLTPSDRLQAARHLNAIELTIKSMQSDWDKMNGAPGIDNHRYLLEIYKGCVASGRGVLAADDNHLSEAHDLFDKADHAFQESLKVIPVELATSENYLLPVRIQQDNLKSRRDRFLPKTMNRDEIH